ncbi:hypothetical protein PTKU46_86090 [Paraburkholderia terrae]
MVTLASAKEMDLFIFREFQFEMVLQYMAVLRRVNLAFGVAFCGIMFPRVCAGQHVTLSLFLHCVHSRVRYVAGLETKDVVLPHTQSEKVTGGPLDVT